MKRQINFKRLRAFLVLATLLLVGVYQQEINRPAAESKPESIFVNVPENSALQTSSCGCKDKKEMLYRIREIQAIIAEYKKQMPAFQAANTKFSQDAKANLKAALQTVADNTRAAEPAPKPNSAQAETDPHSCNITFNRQGTPCLAEAIKRHELYHSKVCTMNKPSRLNPASDYRDGTTMVAHVQEEIEAYTIEMNHLQAELGKLPDSCNTSNWSLYYEVKARYHDLNFKPDNRKNWKSYDIERTYSGTVELSPSAPKAKLPATPQQMAVMTPQQILQAMQNQAMQSKNPALKSWSYNLPTPLKYVPLDVEINDKIVSFTTEDCGGGMYEDTTTTKTWVGNGKDGSQNTISLDTNSATNTYNITIPLFPMLTVPQLNFRESIEIDRTFPPAYKGPRTGNPKPPKMPFANAGFFTVTGILENAQIHHSADQPFNVVENTLTYDPGWVKANNPLPPELKGLEGKLEIKIYYRLSRIPS